MRYEAGPSEIFKWIKLADYYNKTKYGITCLQSASLLVKSHASVIPCIADIDIPVQLVGKGIVLHVGPKNSIDHFPSDVTSCYCLFTN